MLIANQHAKECCLREMQFTDNNETAQQYLI